MQATLAWIRGLAAAALSLGADAAQASRSGMSTGFPYELVEVFVNRIDASSGSLLDAAGRLLSTGPNREYPVSVAWGTTTALAVWLDNREGGQGFTIYGARVDVATGALLDPSGIALSRSPNSGATGDVRFSCWLVAPDAPPLGNDLRNGDQSTFYEAGGCAVLAATSDTTSPVRGRSRLGIPRLRGSSLVYTTARRWVDGAVLMPSGGRRNERWA